MWVNKTVDNTPPPVYVRQCFEVAIRKEITCR